MNNPASDSTLRVRIAEAQGWEEVHVNTAGKLRGHPRIDGNLCDDELEDVPDWPEDLNACRQLEHWLEYECNQWYGDESATSAPEAYMAHLQEIVGGDDWLFMGATARQRCLAYLAYLATINPQEGK